MRMARRIYAVPEFGTQLPRASDELGHRRFPRRRCPRDTRGFEDEYKLPVGTQFMQGATLMHELGHNFELTHAGLHQSNSAPREPNCKPNYHSVMNYLYQLRGLPDVNGTVRMDYSAEVLGGLNETSLSDGGLSGTPRYRSGWYCSLADELPQGPGESCEQALRRILPWRRTKSRWSAWMPRALVARSTGTRMANSTRLDCRLR